MLPNKADIDKNSAELIDEFIKHREEFYVALNAPLGTLDDHTIFEGWAIQKISSLQVLLLNQAECYKMLIFYLKREGILKAQE